MQPIKSIAAILEPSHDKTSDSVRLELAKQLKNVRENFTAVGDEEMVKTVLSYTDGFWNGLFTCYDHSYMPRTNNDLERFFRNTKKKHRRTTGLRSWNEYILRCGEYIVFVDDALQQTDIVQRLSSVSYDMYKAEVKQWRLRLSESTKRRQFRNDPMAYLKKVEFKWMC
ncbi:hypothetical protein [Alicyclobacillus dauci]|uniref:Transposase n=1 Tax=Alicyclobacillus dauci TaxID=1475485 RepID=A0ABY6Z5I1_9BACL|nr:hypothetical protein [Alicyclobacillus dauci]WAH37544.1 hypothetical protein NZD86_03145 [Alicyclobacillus dauci]